MREEEKEVEEEEEEEKEEEDDKTGTNIVWIPFTSNSSLIKLQIKNQLQIKNLQTHIIQTMRSPPILKDSLVLSDIMFSYHR